MSFGFKHGPPREEDLAFDVRFLPNPHYEPELRELTGHDERVVEYIARDGRLEELYERLHALLDFLLPQYVAEGKAHLVIAIGCTGGRHRSVAIAEHLAERYRDHEDLDVAVAHRDIDKRPGASERPRRWGGRRVRNRGRFARRPADSLPGHAGRWSRAPRPGIVHFRFRRRNECRYAVGINGFGRIGRNVFRAARLGGGRRQARTIEWVAVNDLTDSADAGAPAQVRLDPRPLPGHGPGAARAPWRSTDRS